VTSYDDRHSLPLIRSDCTFHCQPSDDSTFSHTNSKHCSFGLHNSHEENMDSLCRNLSLELNNLYHVAGKSCYDQQVIELLRLSYSLSVFLSFHFVSSVHEIYRKLGQAFEDTLSKKLLHIHWDNSSGNHLDDEALNGDDDKRDHAHVVERLMVDCNSACLGLRLNVRFEALDSVALCNEELHSSVFLNKDHSCEQVFLEQSDINRDSCGVVDGCQGVAQTDVTDIPSGFCSTLLRSFDWLSNILKDSLTQID
jgi:hypothetical protein